MIVFGDRENQYFQAQGTIITTCLNKCNLEIIDYIDDSTLNYLLRGDDFEMDEEGGRDYWNREVNDYLNTYFQHEKLIIHGVAKVNTRLIGRNDEETTTDFIWKNRFVSNRLSDSLEEDYFEVTE